MNLRGWCRSSFTHALGSKDRAALDGALARIAESLPREPARAKAAAWLRTLVDDGFPLRGDRGPAAGAADGGLLSIRAEAEYHAIAVFDLVRTTARPEYLDLAGESSVWTHDAVGSLYRELAACGFTKSRQCPIQYFTWMSRLSGGSPLFGDEFRPDWSFYSWFGTPELADLASTLRAAAEFKRPLPPGLPPSMAERLPVELSEGGKQFAGELAGWLRQLHAAGQDAFVLWW